MKSTQPSLALIGLHDFLIFSNRMAHAWSVEAGNMFGISLLRPSRQSNISTSGKERFKYPYTWENKIRQMLNALPQIQQRQSTPHPMPCLHPPPGWPPGISICFALDGKFCGVGTLALSIPWGENEKEGKCPFLRQHCHNSLIAQSSGAILSILMCDFLFQFTSSFVTECYSN